MTLVSDLAPQGAESISAVPARYLCILFPAADSSPGALPWVLRKVWPCAAGQVIATVLPAGEGPPDSPRPIAVDAADVELGSNTAWNAEQTAVVAVKAGHIQLRHKTLSVEETLEIDDDLDLSAGPIDFPGPIALAKNILDLAKLSAAGDITVHGSVEAATLNSGGNITVHHGICGKETGRVTAAGSITTRFASNARIAAGGDLFIGKDVGNSELSCRGKCNAENASVLSSRITATQAILCDSAGSDAGIRVHLDLAFPPEELQRITQVLTEVKAHRGRAAHIRTAVEPLMAMSKRLTAAQKEQATELLCAADEAEMLVAELLKSLEPCRAQLAQIMAGYVLIKNHLYPGVAVTIAGVQTVVTAHVRGPIKFVRRDEGNTPVIVALDGHNRATSVRVSLTADHAFLRQLQLGQF